MQAAHTVCTYTSEMLAFELNADNTLKGLDGTSGPYSHMASFLHDRALVGICRWHGGLCLPSVVFGIIPRPI